MELIFVLLTCAVTSVVLYLIVSRPLLPRRSSRDLQELSQDTARTDAAQNETDKQPGPRRRRPF
jgi:hypothetical protein